MPELVQLDVPGLWRLGAETNGYLLVRGDRSLLIDCPALDLAPVLRAAGLPLPEIVLHTQVQEEHTREWASFPEARVYVEADCAAIALRTPEFFAACQTVWPADRNWDYRGEERYGIGGCPTERPPQEPLQVAGLLKAGETFTWEGIALEVLALPGSGKRSLGFFWREAGVLFSGDMIYAGGYVVNFYDFERGYGTPDGYQQEAASLAMVASLSPTLLLPTTGPVITDPVGDITRLQERMAWLAKPPRRANPHPNPAPLRTFGRYKEVVPGIYQSNNWGNVVLYVDADGNGLMVDPDPCIWLDWPAATAEVHADLDLLEQETGLKRIEIALITHYHGDHCEYSNLLRARYGTVIAAAPDVAAVLKEPQAYRLPCSLDWYNIPFDHIDVDRRLVYEETFCWHDVPVTPIHTPGHCFAHSGFLIPWRGMLTASIGETLQNGGGSTLSSNIPFTYNDNAWPDRSFLVAYRRLQQAKPALLLCGHSHYVFDPDGGILADIIAVTEEAHALAAAMVAGGDTLRAMTPPGNDARRPATVEAVRT
jgi:glyoxylase-like metal-dependent hydrolase (beta-lactamase superfamily II)